MTEAAGTPRFRRILVALDTAERSGAAIEEAARLAAGLRAELVGVFIEDTELMHAAALSVTRIVHCQTRTLAAFDPASMRRAYRVRSAETRRSLETAAAHWRIKCSFQIERGIYAEQLLASIREGDLLALTSSGRQRQSRAGAAALGAVARTPCPLFLMRQARAPGRPVVVLYEGSPDALSLGRAERASGEPS